MFPFVFTTSRLTEHHTAGGMSRYVARLAELQPEMFVEVSPELAAGAGTGERWLVPRRDRPRRGRGPGAGDRPALTPARRGTDGPPGVAALPLGHRRDGHRRLGERPVRHLPRPQRADPGEQGGHLRRTRRTAADRCRAAPARRGLPTSLRGVRRPRPAYRDHRAGHRQSTTTATRPQHPPEDPDGRQAQPVRAGGPCRRRGVRRRPPQAQGVLHRHQHLHRLQGLRGGVQGVERRPGRPLRDAGLLLRQQLLAERQPVAPRRVHRAAEADGGAGVGPSPTGGRAGRLPGDARHGRTPGRVEGRGDTGRRGRAEVMLPESGRTTPWTGRTSAG